MEVAAVEDELVVSAAKAEDVGQRLMHTYEDEEEEEERSVRGD